MKRLLLVVGLVAVFAAAFWWFERKRPEPPPAPPAVPQADTLRMEREGLFGADALTPDIEWRPSGLGYRIAARGTPPTPGIGQPVRIIYRGRLKDGTVFDRSEQPTEFLIGATIPGLSTGLQMLGTGGKATFFIPPSQGYGARKVMGIPPNSGLIFDVEVASVGP